MAPMAPTAQAAAKALTIRLLESLAAKEERVSQPILSNSERQRSDRQRSADEPRLALRREERGTV